MITIRPIQSHEWRILRQMRLAALTDAPMAFGSTLAREQPWTDEEWAERVKMRNETGVSVTLLAFVDGDCCGIIGGARDKQLAEHGWVISMWVAPAVRRRGIALKLLRALEEWAISHGISQLKLEVNEINSPAIALYEQYGFSFTGETIPYPNAPDMLERVMVKRCATL
jgi:ribosomal protein S18 acetylase RimI-like enzyme